MELLLRIDNFEGPLELLLHLIEKKKMKISEIKISQLIDEYLTILNEAKENSLEIKVDFLVIASELLEIKALSLLRLNREEDKEKELKRRLEEYKLFKELSLEISKLENEYNISYSRGEGRKIIKTVSKEYDLSKLTLDDFFLSYKKYLDALPEREFLEIEFEKKYSMAEEMEKIYLSLYSGKKKTAEIFSRAECRMHLVYIFLAILDLYREGRIDIEEDLCLRVVS
jgi:segregation and condensation protein A